VINLFSLMLDAGIPDIALERDKTVMKVARNALFNEFKKLLILNMFQILERFHLQLSDEEACKLIVRLIESSLSAKMPLLVDLIHHMTQVIKY
jgi:phosphatidylinositol 3-kinase